MSMLEFVPSLPSFLPFLFHLANPSIIMFADVISVRSLKVLVQGFKVFHSTLHLRLLLRETLSKCSSFLLLIILDSP